MISETNNFSFNVTLRKDDFIRVMNNTFVNTLPSRLWQINNNENTIKDNTITTNNRFNQIEKLIKEIQTSMNLNINNNIKSFNQIKTKLYFTEKLKKEFQTSMYLNINFTETTMKNIEKALPNFFIMKILNLKSLKINFIMIFLRIYTNNLKMATKIIHVKLIIILRIY